MESLSHLNWRYAVKRYNRSHPLTSNEVAIITETIRLAPTSLGLQTFKVWVIGPDSPHREALSPILHKQPQAIEASHLFLFAAQLHIGTKEVQEHVERMANTRNQDIRDFDKFVQGVNGFLQNQSEDERRMWTHKQTYIALGMAMSEAARAGIDTTPMEGFDAEALDGYLGLREKGYASSVILAAGKRDATNDYLTGKAKVRKTSDMMFEWI